jgi:hypothetical protein
MCGLPGVESHGRSGKQTGGGADNLDRVVPLLAGNVQQRAQAEILVRIHPAVAVEVAGAAPAGVGDGVELAVAVAVQEQQLG